MFFAALAAIALNFGMMNDANALHDSNVQAASTQTVSSVVDHSSLKAIDF